MLMFSDRNVTHVPTPALLDCQCLISLFVTKKIQHRFIAVPTVVGHDVDKTEMCMLNWAVACYYSNKCDVAQSTLFFNW